MTKKLEYTRGQAIADCKEMWEQIVRLAGGNKLRFLYSGVDRPEYDKFANNCPLCHYARQFAGDDCKHCPLIAKYNLDCLSLGFRATGKSTPAFIRAIKGL